MCVCFGFQQRWRDRIQCDDTTGVSHRGAGWTKDTQTLADHCDRVGIRPYVAMAGKRNVELNVRDHGQANRSPVGHVVLSGNERLVTIVQRYPLPLSVSRSVHHTRQSGAPGQYMIIIIILIINMYYNGIRHA